VSERVGAVDLGTNSVLLTIAEPAVSGLRAVLERATVTRLGQGVDQTRRLHPDACARTLACLQDYRRELDALCVTRVAAVGTSALRDAEFGAEFRAQASAALGTEIEVISGPREAALSFAGALSGLPERGRIFVFDIGGGSTELVWGAAAGDGCESARTSIERSTSLDVGSVRLHERFGIGDPPRPGALADMRIFVRATLQGYLPDPEALGPLDAVVGVAGTVTSLTALCLGLTHYQPERVHGAHMNRLALRALAARLAALPLIERERLPGLDKGRADVIVSGALLCTEVLDWLGADELVASDRGVRWGLLQELTRTP